MGIEWGVREWIKGWAQEYKAKAAIVTIRVCSFPQEPVPRKDSWWDISCSDYCLSHENPVSDPMPPCGLWQMVASNWTLTEQSKEESVTWDNTGGAGVWGTIHSQHSCSKNCNKNKNHLRDCLWPLQIKTMQQMSRMQRYFKGFILFWLMHDEFIPMGSCSYEKISWEVLSIADAYQECLGIIKYIWYSVQLPV